MVTFAKRLLCHLNFTEFLHAYRHVFREYVAHQGKNKKVLNIKEGMHFWQLCRGETSYVALTAYCIIEVISMEA